MVDVAAELQHPRGFFRCFLPGLFMAELFSLMPTPKSRDDGGDELYPT
jgi:hypothetical protein